MVAWAKTLEPQAATGSSPAYPTPGVRDKFDLRFWDDHGRPTVLEMWGRLNYGLAVVVTEDCGLDKEFNVLVRQFLGQGISQEEAAARAHEHADPYLAVAEAWPVEAFPPHMRGGAESGALGYLPFLLGDLVPQDPRPYAIDVGRIATISWRAIHRRLASGDDAWRLQIQTALCKAFAARNLELAANFLSIFEQPILRAEAVTPPSGNPPRVRIRLYFRDGRNVTLEGSPPPQAPEQQDPPEPGRPGLVTRD